MKSTAKLYFTIVAILDLILAIILTCTIVGLILAIPLYIAYGKFNKAKNMNESELVQNRSSLFGWGIFSAIVLAPSLIGLVIILIFTILVNNYIKDLESGNMEKANMSLGEILKAETSNAVQGTKEAFGIKSGVDKVKNELEKLKKLYDEDLITKEEYEQKRKKILDIE